MLFEHATNKKSIENAERLELKVLRDEYLLSSNVPRTRPPRPANCVAHRRAAT